MAGMTDIRDIPGTARLVAGVGGGEDFVAWAIAALELEFDTPSVVRLAVEEPPFFEPSLRQRFEWALDEIQMTRVAPRVARIIWAQEVAAELEAGRMSPSRCASLISEIFAGEDVPASFDDWAALDETRNCELCGYGGVPEAPDADASIRSAAVRLLQYSTDVPLA
jgi:hypothetical protein